MNWIWILRSTGYITRLTTISISSGHWPCAGWASQRVISLFVDVRQLKRERAREGEREREEERERGRKRERERKKKKEKE